MPYFDHNATSPLLPVAREAWLRAQDEAWANPSSPSRIGARAHRLLEAAREQVAGYLGVAPREIVFTSGATEGNNAVLAWAARKLPPHAPIVISPTEHPSVLEPARELFGARIHWLGVSRDGWVNPDEVSARLGGVLGGLVVVMAANNETGLVQTATMDIAALCQRAGAWFLCDATQWIGRMPARDLAPDAFVVGSAHKFGGPKGVGFVRVPPAATGFRGQRGGEQEYERRAGTENLPAIMALLAALEFAEEQSPVDRFDWSTGFAADVVRRVPGARVNSGEAARLWNTVSLCLPAHENTRWVTRLDKLGFEVSTGSACASGSSAPSHVLAAMGLTPEEARRTIRVSSGWETTRADWRALAEAIVNVWQQLQAEGAS
jgi:cysteine desulfurase